MRNVSLKGADGKERCYVAAGGCAGEYTSLAVNLTRNVSLKGADDMELRDAAVANGMKTLRRAGINAALMGYTSLEEVLTATL